MELKAAIFDMDGTLIDSLMIWDVLWDEMGKNFCGGAKFRPEPADDKFVRTVPAKEAMEMIHARYGLGKDGEELLRVFNKVSAEFYAEKVQLKPGVRAWLEYCKSRGVKMCIASATAPALLQLALDHCDLGKYFLKLFSCADLGKGKEHPDVFLAAQAYLGESLEDTWVFEDSCVAVETAVGAGMPTVAIYDRFNYGQDRMRQIATHYIAEGETLEKLMA